MKSAGGALLTAIALERGGPVPLYRQFYLRVRQQILSGHLPGGARLPSTRTLCKELGLSRITILNAFDQLTAEGFLASRTGAGTFVSEEWIGRAPPAGATGKHPQLSTLGQSMLSLRSGYFGGVSYAAWAPDCPVSFLPSHPAYDAFPERIWKRLLNRHLRKPTKSLLGYGELKGVLRLRRAVVDYISDARGIECDVEQVVIVSGAQQAFNILSMLLLNPQDSVWMEDPGHIAARIVFQAQGTQLAPLRIDAQGLDVQQGLRERPDARLAFTTPSRQHPLGATMSHSRRQELTDWAARRQAWIVEDDCDSEFRYVGRSPPALFAMDQAQRVIYVGTFSKVLYPSLRLGYVILPEALVEPFCAVRAVLDRSPPTLLQETVADFMIEGHFLGHIRRMRSLYQARQAALLEQLQRRLGGFLRVAEAQVGLHMMAWLPEAVDDEALAQGLGQHDVFTYALSDYCMTRYLPPGLLLGFAATPEHQAADKAIGLVRALKALGHAV